MREQLWLVAAFLALAIVGWAVTDQRMAGMDAGPGTDLGTLGFYTGVWVVMMAAMMFPSAWPMVLSPVTAITARALSASSESRRSRTSAAGCAPIPAFSICSSRSFVERVARAGERVALGQLALRAEAPPGALAAVAGRWRDVLSDSERTFREREPAAALLGDWPVAVFERVTAPRRPAAPGA